MKFLIFILLLSSSLLTAANFSAERIEQACRNFVHQKSGSNYTLRFSQSFNDLQISGSSVKAVFDEKYSSKNNAVKLDFYSQDQLIKSKIFPYTLYKAIVVYKADTYIPRHEKITADMLSKKFEEVKLNEIDNTKNVIGKIAKRPISEDEIVNSENSIADVSVKRGEDITLIASNGTIKIRAKGTAMEDGRAGDLIRIKRTGSRKILKGKVNEDGDILLGE